MTQRRSTIFGGEVAKKFYDGIGKYDINGQPNFYSFFLGGATDLSNQGKNSTGQGNNTYENSELWNGMNVLRKIGKNDTSLVVERKDWKSGTAYHPWKSSGQDRGFENFYALNPTNMVVYLCISDNVYNRFDRRGKSGSTLAPTHLTGMKSYGDGYTWLALYKIEWSQEIFLNDTWMPVPSIEDYNSVSETASPSSNASRICGAGGVSDCGTCCLYYTSSFNDTVGGLTFGAGDLYNSTQLKCYQCIDMANRMGMDYTFSAGSLGCTAGSTSDCSPCDNTVCSCTYDYISKSDAVRANKDLSSIGNFKIQADAIKDSNDNDGRIISAFIDLSGYSKKQLEVSAANPEITITSITGKNASLKFVTSSDGISHFIEGITISNAGSLYRDYQITDALGFENDIEINIDKVDGIAVNSRDLLDVCTVMFSIRIKSTEITDDAGTAQSTFKNYGIVQNVEIKTSDGTKIPLGSGQSVSQSNVWNRATNKFVVEKAPSVTQQGMGTKFNPGTKVLYDGDGSKGNPQSLLWDYNSSTSTGNLELALNRTIEGLEESLTNFTTDDDTDTSFIITSSDLSSVVPDTGKFIHTVTDSNFNLTMPGEGEEPQMFTFKIIKSFC